jgi:hypothetical protein
MIIVNIKSGIGNQLFQYAFGRKLSILNNSKLKLSLNEYNNVTLIHKTDSVAYRLNKFNINAEVATDFEISSFKKDSKFQKSKLNLFLKSKLGLLSKVYNRFFKRYENFSNAKNNIIHENNPFLKGKNIFELRGNLYFDGYWAGYQHLSDIRNILLKELILQNDVKTEKHGKWLRKIKETNNSVSIHIRGLSGELCERYANYFGVPALDYYQRAIDKIVTVVDNPVFFIFTDNWEWTNENFHTKYQMHFVKDIGKINDYLDSDFLEIDLMSKCKHNIIINSTFSWWGAWLNKNPDKCVIAPARWFIDPKAQQNYEKGLLVPPEWIKI